MFLWGSIREIDLAVGKLDYKAIQVLIATLLEVL